MFDFMDSRFRTRWILLINVGWILTFLLIGVNSQPDLEMIGTRMLGTTVNFNCSSSSDKASQFYAQFFKDGTDMVLIPIFGSQNAINIKSRYANKITAASGSFASANSTLYYYTMDLLKLQCADEGNYTCSVNIDGNSVSSTVVSLQVKSNAQMPNLTAPTDFVVVGDTVTLTCTANVGKPAKNLSLCVWQGKGFNCSEASKLVDLGNCSYSQTATMTVNITEDMNQAMCEVKPSDGNLKASQTWEVQYPVPAIKFVPDDPILSIMEGNTELITCEARGKPTPDYTWTFQPKVGPSDRASWPKFQKSITLTDVDISNMGVYTCVASNNIRNVTYSMTKSITINIVPTTPAPTTKPTTTPVKTSSGGTIGQTPKTGPQTNEDDDDDWKLIVGIVCAILFLIILLIVIVIFYRRRSKPTEIEEPPEKPRNNHEVNMKETKPDLVYSTGLEKGKHPMYNTGFDHNGEDDLYYAELAFDDKPRSRKPVVPLYDNSSNNNPYTTVMPQV